MNSYTMVGKLTCGPDALAFVTGTNIDDMFDLWTWPILEDWRCNLRDNPGAHYRALVKLKIPWRVVPLGEILAGRLPINKVVCLLHAPDDPKTIEPESLLQQHWVVIESVLPPRSETRPDGTEHEINRGVVTAHMGNGHTRCFSFEEFTALYKDGTPACAYVVGQGTLTGNKLDRAWDWLLEHTTC
jgi:hypothetical protein